MSVKALAKNVRIAPRKVGEVVTLVRGRTVADALTILDHTPRRSAVAVKKAIQSAAANADYNHNFKLDTLYLKEITVTPGPRYKRYRPAARGMALPYELKTSHIRVIVDGPKREPKAKKPAVKKEAK